MNMRVESDRSGRYIAAIAPAAARRTHVGFRTLIAQCNPTFEQRIARRNAKSA